MNSKIVLFFQYMYKYFQVSLCFWLSLLKGLVVYSIVPSFCTLFLVLRDINKGEDEEKNKNVKLLFNHYYESFKMYKVTSFIYTFSMIIVYTCLFFVNKQTNAFSLVLSILLIYFLAMVLLMLTYSTAFLAFKNMNVKDGNIHAFLAIIKNPINSVSILVIIILLFIAAGYNLVFFVVFGPFLYGLGVIFSLVKVLEVEK
ncbi:MULTISPECIES: DUF624 domain-containing protein [Metabacillus]|uniref:DUF624 domain-containing protein n=2 Tax=Metabacillus TaxID=2675233 RepID=A0A179T139_9BACI|nr:MULTISPECIES: DUF624 domain-containing protein [Metabacillus]OAS87595.1 hypothetical protein A6K24_19310 [Metabacillus litoralis]QNF27008.1 DUF624 domain-containing protein [Metabacillus sp. KUDC1714]